MIALVGDRKWERWMASFCKPFTRAKVRYFDKAEVDTAWKWLEENKEGTDQPWDAHDDFDRDGYPWSW